MVKLTFALPLGSSVQGRVSIRPLEFVSPVTLNEHARDEPDREQEVENDEEEDDDSEGETLIQMLRLPSKLLFGHNQAVEDPRDGLSLFGPFDVGKTYGIRPAVIGTRAGIDRFWHWVESIQRPINRCYLPWE